MFFRRHHRWSMPIAVAIIGSSMAFGCSHRSCNNDDRADRITKKVSSELDLTKDQEVKLKAIVLNVQTSLPDMDSTKKEMWSEFYGQVKSDKIDQEKLNAILNQNRDKMSLAIPKVTAGFAEFYAILTPEQKTELKEKMDKINKHFIGN
ncbi:MAG: Spy/CpxP family protein refolding chaperone [Bacteroidetes bacterium]|nr:Spy/CpxP family protein refolding chaperone [Bacteroidota bacterium]